MAKFLNNIRKTVINIIYYQEVVVGVLFLLLLTIVNIMGVIINARIITPINMIQHNFFLLFLCYFFYSAKFVYAFSM